VYSVAAATAAVDEIDCVAGAGDGDAVIVVIVVVKEEEELFSTISDISFSRMKLVRLFL
jgi:hypothetical protein